MGHAGYSRKSYVWRMEDAFKWIKKHHLPVNALLEGLGAVCFHLHPPRWNRIGLFAFSLTLLLQALCRRLGSVCLPFICPLRQLALSCLL